MPFKSAVSVVEVDVAVAGKDGPIDGLKLADFAVQDNRRSVTLRYASQDDSSLDVVFLFDLSKLMKSKLLQMRTTAEAAMAELRPADRVAVMSFRENSSVELPLTGDLNAAKVAVRNGLYGAAFGGKAVILPAAHAAAKYLAGTGDPHGRRVVVIFTGDSGSAVRDLSHAGVAKDFWEADASLNVMVIPNAITRLMQDSNPANFNAVHQLGLAFGFSAQDSVDEVAELTGGEVVYAATVGDIRKEDNPYAANPSASLREVMRQTRRRYRLYYDLPPGNPGQRRQIHVALGPAAQALHPGARIIGRKGYVMPQAAAH